MQITNWTQYRQNTTDWTLKDWDKVLIPENNWNKLKKSFWQYPVNRNSCSIHWIMTAIANTFDVDFPLKERKEIWEKAKKLWASEKWWWRFDKAINLLKNHCEETWKQRFRYYVIQKEEFEKYAKMWFMIYWGIRIKEWSTRDKLKDWVIWDDVENYWDTKFWHAVCFWMIWDKFWFIDNYPEKTSVNEPVFKNLDKLLDKWYFFNTWYILMTDNPDEITDALSRRKEVQDKKKELTK